MSEPVYPPSERVTTLTQSDIEELRGQVHEGATLSDKHMNALCDLAQAGGEAVAIVQRALTDWLGDREDAPTSQEWARRAQTEEGARQYILDAIKASRSLARPAALWEVERMAAIPEGFALVPLIPTEAMIDAVISYPFVVECETRLVRNTVITTNKEHRDQRYIVDSWQAMLNAALAAKGEKP